MILFIILFLTLFYVNYSHFLYCKTSCCEATLLKVQGKDNAVEHRASYSSFDFNVLTNNHSYVGKSLNSALKILAPKTFWHLIYCL